VAYFVGNKKDVLKAVEFLHANDEKK
jgi:hypothetical protein